MPVVSLTHPEGGGAEAAGRCVINDSKIPENRAFKPETANLRNEPPEARRIAVGKASAHNLLQPDVTRGLGQGRVPSKDSTPPQKVENNKEKTPYKAITAAPGELDGARTTDSLPSIKLNSQQTMLCAFFFFAS